MANLAIAGKFNPKQLHQSLFVPNSNLPSISRCGPGNPSTPTFLNINLKKQLEIYLLFQKSQKNSCNSLYFHPPKFDGR